MVILGALIVTNEFYHQTATTTFLTTPHRTAVILAQARRGAVGIAGVFWASSPRSTSRVGSPFFAGQGDDEQPRRMAGHCGRS